ncbi:hypothetical protein [Paenibacillus sp. FSL L8-0708]|uniref:hypothetical protein n=1 Tax=Paenibacillus sp. FSL L8-0708 TaxID=2975311 RepID=UPI0030F884C0
MGIVYGVKSLSKELGYSHASLVRIIAKHPDFPKEKTTPRGPYRFVVHEANAWLDNNQNETYPLRKKPVLLNDAINQNEVVQLLGISRRLVLIWRQQGLDFTKLPDGGVWFEKHKLKVWLQNRSNRQTRAYAEKL